MSLWLPMTYQSNKENTHLYKPDTGRESSSDPFRIFSNNGLLQLGGKKKIPGTNMEYLPFVVLLNNVCCSQWFLPEPLSTDGPTGSRWRDDTAHWPGRSETHAAHTKSELTLRSALTQSCTPYLLSAQRAADGIQPGPVSPVGDQTGSWEIKTIIKMFWHMSYIATL